MFAYSRFGAHVMSRRGSALAVALVSVCVVWACDAPDRHPVPSAVPHPTAATTIRQLAGCFEVTYRFVEDGVDDLFSANYVLTEPTKEWVGFRHAGPGRFQLPHALFIEGRPIAHWYEEWSQVPGREEWRQEIWGGEPGPDAELRYGCTAPWTGNRWECHAGRAEKPLRDDRRDYDWLDRTNVLQVTPLGYVQNQNNRKMRESGEVVASELGWVTYAHLPDAECGPGPQRFPIEPLEPPTR